MRTIGSTVAGLMSWRMIMALPR